MDKKHFSVNDKFESIISNELKTVEEIDQIKTGWTNFVFKVKSGSDSYYFRFPRNTFFANALVKECKILSFVKNKISFETPELKLCFNKKRAFTIHKEILGQSLSEVYPSLSKSEKEDLAKDICKMLKEFYAIKLNKNLQRVSSFLDDLSKVSKNNYEISVHTPLRELEAKSLVFSHGDFNPGNLILRDNKLCAVIDFAFSGSSHQFTDVSRLTGRLPSDFSNIFLSCYEKELCTKVEKEQIFSLEKVWQYVEEKYVLYIKKNHPDIILPEPAR